MPTGYTHHIENGDVITGKDFIMLCARQFGALIEMREEPLDAPIPNKFEVSTYHFDRLNEANIELKQLDDMTDDEIQEIIDKNYEENQKECLEKIKKDGETYQRHLKVLNEIEEWDIPSIEHQELKKFAMNQINMVLSEYDGHYYKEKIKEEKPTVKVWKTNKRKDIKWSIDYHTKEYIKEQERTANRNKWVKDLRDSLE